MEKEEELLPEFGLVRDMPVLGFVLMENPEVVGDEAEGIGFRQSNDGNNHDHNLKVF